MAVHKAPTTTWLRAEGLALGLLSILPITVCTSPRWIFAVLFLSPDLSMLAYFRGPRLGAIAYNVVHCWVLVVLGFFVVWLFWRDNLFLLSLPRILAAHIGIDRALGYGLKLPTGFRDTDLGRIGKAA